LENLIQIIEFWLEQDFSDVERHLRRIKKIEKITN
jgi:ribose 5-phosphate isomerase RpiB